MLYTETPDTVNFWKVIPGQRSWNGQRVVTSFNYFEIYNVHALEFQFWKASFKHRYIYKVIKDAHRFSNI